LQALPITVSHLKEMYNYVDINKEEDLAVWCSILVGFFGLLRKKNLVPEDLQDLDPTKILTVGNFVIDKEKGIVLVYIPFSKTNQFGQRNLVIPLVRNSCKALDPLFHLDLLFSRTKADPNLPAFSFRSRNQLRFVTYRSFTAKLKSLLSKAGFSPEKFSGHSLRRGGATFLHSCGASILQIQACGDWQSSVWTRYIYISLEQRLLSQHLMASSIGSDL
jgi:integrase